MSRQKWTFTIIGDDPLSGRAVIYVLRAGGDIRYVGKTTGPLLARLKGHWYDGLGATKRAWIRSLEAPPILEVVDYVAAEEATAAEKSVVGRLLALGRELVNSYHAPAGRTVRGPLAPCGTEAARKRHRKDVEPPCAICEAEADRRYQERIGAHWQQVRAEAERRNPCGTRAAADRHRRKGEPLCEPCKEAERAYHRSLHVPSTWTQELAPCGTLSAASRHKRRKEPLDEACLEARRAYDRQRDRKRRRR